MSDLQDQVSIPHGELLRMTTDVVSAYVGKNVVATGQISDVINLVFNSLSQLNGHSRGLTPEPLKPADAVRPSINPAYILCFADGQKPKMLKPQLRTPLTR